MTLHDDGSLNSPYLICVRADGYFTDTTLLQLFGLADYVQADVEPKTRRKAVVADAGEWTVLADDWYYTLWHMPETRPAIAALGSAWDVFACSVGDSDRSFDFVYYQDGRLVRRYVVEDPHYRGGKVTVDEGAALPGEAEAFREEDDWRRVLAVARSLDITTTFTATDVRVYVPPTDRTSRR